MWRLGGVVSRTNSSSAQTTKSSANGTGAGYCSSPTTKPSPPSKSLCPSSTKRLTCDGSAIFVHGVKHEPFTELYFKHDTSRTGTHQTNKLVLEQVDLGIRNDCTRGCRDCNGSCGLHFIRKITIQACFKSFTADQCYRVSLEPQHTCQVFVKQRTSSQSLKLSLCNLKQSSVEFQEGNATSHTVPAYGWEAASRDRAKNSVTWTWAISNLNDGSELRLNKTRSGRLPQLPISPTFFHMNSKSFQAEAVWELEAPEEAVPLEWNVKVVISTVQIQRGNSLLQRLLGRYAFIDGNELTYERLLTFQ